MRRRGWSPEPRAGAQKEKGARGLAWDRAAEREAGGWLRVVPWVLHGSSLAPEATDCHQARPAVWGVGASQVPTIFLSALSLPLHGVS